MLADNFPVKGSWNAEVFHNDNPIVLELGCGRAADPADILCFKTYYEQMWLAEGKPITYLAFRL